MLSVNNMVWHYEYGMALRIWCGITNMVWHYEYDMALRNGWAQTACLMDFQKTEDYD